MNSIFTFFYDLTYYAWVGRLALFFSYPLAYGSIIIILLWTVIYGKRKLYSFNLLFLSVVFSWILANIIKLIFHTGRPFTHFDIAPLYIENSYSFPSSHAAVFASLGISLYFINKRLGILFIILAFFIGLSRMVIGVHYPIDVFFGWLLGAGISFLLIKVFKKI